MCIYIYIYIYIYIISSLCPKTVSVDYSFIEYMRNIISICVSAQCMSIVNPFIPSLGYHKIHIQSLYSIINWKLKPQLKLSS